MSLPAINARWRFNFDRYLSDEEADYLAQIPGVWTRGKLATCTWNAVATLQGILAAGSRRYQLVAPKQIERARALFGDEAAIKGILAKTELKAWVWDYMTPYQRKGCRFSIALEGGHLRWDPGTGKTLAFTAFSLAGPFPVVIITKTQARLQVSAQLTQYADLKPHVVLPKVERKGVDQDTALNLYLDECAAFNRRPVVVAGGESLDAAMAARLATIDSKAKRGGFTLVIDESQVFKASKRWRARVDSDGNKEYSALDNHAVAVKGLSQAAAFRLGATATPAFDRVADLYAQLDLINPGGYGGKSDFEDRYCDARIVEGDGYAHRDVSGVSNAAELKARVHTEMHAVDAAQAKGHLPPKRIQVVYVAPCQQERPAAGFVAALRKQAKEDHGPDAQLNERELRLQEAASRLSKWLLAFCGEWLEHQGKVIIFEGRQDIVEKTAVKFAKTHGALLGLSEGWTPQTQDLTGKNGRLFVAHGELLGSRQVREIQRTWMGSMIGWTEAELAEVGGVRPPPLDGPALLVGTFALIGTGLDWHDTNLLVWAELPANYGRLRQGEDRIWRLGSLRDVLVVYPIAEGTYAERMVDMLSEKLDTTGRVIADEALPKMARALSGIATVEDRAALLAQLIENGRETLRTLEVEL